jgi:putative SOS response-associated peptidase YedK
VRVIKNTNTFAIMCYYNSISISKGTKVSLNGITKELPPIDRPLQSGFDYGDWPIIKPNGEDYDIELAHWELIAPWIKTEKEVKESREKFNTLNATSEKLLESRLYKDLIIKRRCLILSSGFYEWRHFKLEHSKKDIAYPYFVSIKDKPYFFMAGICQPWIDQETGEKVDTFSIITTKANGIMEQIHNKKKRMPTILNEAQASEWLKSDLSVNRIQELSSNQIDSSLMSYYTLRKDFRTAIDQKEGFDYEGLPII